MTRSSGASTHLSAKTYPSGIHVRLDAWVNDGGLVIQGQDTGGDVSSIWGDSDYEYWLSVDRKHFPKVLEALASELEAEVGEIEDDGHTARVLLDLLKQAWSEEVFDTDVDFRKWLNAIHVPSEFSSYA